MWYNFGIFYEGVDHMELPSFREFLESMDMNAVSYDIGLNSTNRLNKPCPFSEDQVKYIADAIFAETMAFLGQYHGSCSVRGCQPTPVAAFTRRRQKETAP